MGFVQGFSHLTGWAGFKVGHQRLVKLTAGVLWQCFRARVCDFMKDNYVDMLVQ